MPIYAQSSTLRNLTIPLVDVDHTTLAQDHVLQYNATTGKFENQELSLSNSDFITSAENLGAGEIIYANEVGTILQFKTIVAGGGISLSSTGTELTIDTAGAAVTASNIGTGVGVFSSKIGLDLEFRSLSTGTGNINLTVAQNGDDIEFINTAEINTASSLGAGEAVFAQKDTYDLQFKSLVAGTNITLTGDADTVTIDAAPAPATAFSYQFTVNFDAAGNVDTVADLPTGWTSNIVANSITFTHTANSMVKQISYWGFDVTNGWQLRMPSAGYQATIPAGSENTSFKININSVAAGADISSQAKVNVIF